MIVGAIAIASERSNAIGAMRLACLEEGLELELLRVGSFAKGYVPSALTSGERVLVPWHAVLRVARAGGALLLAFDGALVRPHNRLALGGFTSEPLLRLHRAYVVRRVAGALALVLPALLAPLATGLSRWVLGPDAAGRALLLGALAAAASWAVARGIERAATWGGPHSLELREAFARELARRAGLEVRDASPETEIANPRPPTPATSIPAAIGGIALLVAGAVLFWEQARLGEPPAPALRPDEGAGGDDPLLVVGPWVPAPAGTGSPVQPPPRVGGSSIAPPALRNTESDARGPEPPRRACVCERGDSPLWKGGVPILSVFTASRFPNDGEVEPRPDRTGRLRYDLDVSVVNNGARPLRDVELLVTFRGKDRRGRERSVERALFYEGELSGGRSVKWRVRAPGGSFSVETKVRGTLESERIEPAPADAFHSLLEARQRPVRHHAALMLAYLGDARALDAASSLLATANRREVLTLDRVLRAARPAVACDLVPRGATGAEVCVFRRGPEARGGPLALAEIVPDGTRPARRWPVPHALGAREGALVALELSEGSPALEAVEVIEER